MAKIKEIRILEPKIKEIKKVVELAPEEKEESEEEETLEDILESEDLGVKESKPIKTSLEESKQERSGALEDSLKDVKTEKKEDKNKENNARLYNQTTNLYNSSPTELYGAAPNHYGTDQNKQGEEKKNDRTDTLGQLNLGGASVNTFDPSKMDNPMASRMYQNSNPQSNNPSDREDQIMKYRGR